MASTKEYLDFVLEQLSGIDEVSYTRVSTAAQTEGYSLEAQQERLREYADYKKGTD